MPEAGYQPDGKQVYISPYPSLAVAAERDIYIFPEPRCQRNMPSFPEFIHGARNIRIVKVFREPEAEHFSETDRHQRITVKIKIYLEGISDRAYPRHLSRHHIIPAHPRGIPYTSEIIG